MVFLKKLKMKKGKKKRVFTIAELMVVIMIIAILAAVTVPVIRARIMQVKWSEEPQPRKTNRCTQVSQSE